MDGLDRIVALEASVRKINEELLSMQRENIVLQREMMKAQREKYELKEVITLSSSFFVCAMTLISYKDLTHSLPHCNLCGQGFVSNTVWCYDSLSTVVVLSENTK